MRLFLIQKILFRKKFIIHYSYLVVFLVAFCSCAHVTTEAVEQCEAYAKSFPAEQAIKICKPLAEKGNAHAQYILGDIYNHEEENMENEKLSFAWTLKAAEQGHLNGLKRRRKTDTHFHNLIWQRCMKKVKVQQ